MSNYQTRPVFEFAIDWTSKPSTALPYEIESYEIGFGQKKFFNIQTYVEHGFRIMAKLLTSSEMRSVDDFFDDINGNQQGFWFPNPQTGMKVVEAISATQFKIKDQGLTETWTSQPSIHFCFSKDSVLQYERIIIVTDNGDGTETVTLNNPVSEAIDPTWDVFKLHYVRLRSSKEPFQMLAEGGRQSRKFDFIELPLEYTTQELGTSPVYLYYMYSTIGGALQEWRFTSYYQDFVSDSETWTAIAIDHSRLERTLRGDSEKASISSEYLAANPMSLFVNSKFPSRLFVDVIEVSVDVPDTQTTEFSGEVEEVIPDGKTLVADLPSVFDNSRNVPRFRIKPGCNYDFLEPATCKLLVANFQITGSIQSIEGTVVNIAAASFFGTSEDYFFGGYVEFVSGSNSEIRTILKSTIVGIVERQFILNMVLNNAVVTDSILVVPGCSKRKQDCKAYGNYVNFGGHHDLPNRNLSLAGVESSPAGGGGKK